MSGINGEVYEALNELTDLVKEWLKRSDEEQEGMRTQTLRLDALEKGQETKLKEVYLAKSREIARKESEFQRRNAKFAEQRNRVNEFREQYYAQRDKPLDKKDPTSVKSCAPSTDEKVWSRKDGGANPEGSHASGDKPYLIPAASGRYGPLVEPVLTAPKRKSKKPERSKQADGLLTPAGKKLVSQRHAGDLRYGANARTSGRTSNVDERENGRHNEWRSTGNALAFSHVTKKRTNVESPHVTKKRTNVESPHVTKKRTNVELRSRSRRSPARSRHRSKHRYRGRSRRRSHSTARSKENRKGRRNGNKSNDRNHHRVGPEHSQHSPSHRSRKKSHSRSRRNHRNRGTGNRASSRNRSPSSVASSRSHSGVHDDANGAHGRTAIAARPEISLSPANKIASAASVLPTVQAKTSSPPRQGSTVLVTNGAPATSKSLSAKSSGRTKSDDKKDGAAVAASTSIPKTARKESSPVADVKPTSRRSRSRSMAIHSRSSSRSSSISKSVSKSSKKDDADASKSRAAITMSRSPVKLNKEKEPTDCGAKTDDKSSSVKEAIANLVAQSG